MAAQPLRLLLIAQDPGDIRRIGDLLREEAPDLVELEGADSVATARRRLGAVRFDLAILDETIGHGAANDTLREFLDTAPGTATVLLSDKDDPESAERSRSLGAAGVISRNALTTGLYDRLQAVLHPAGPAEAGATETVGTSALEAAGEVGWRLPAGATELEVTGPLEALGLGWAKTTPTLSAVRARLHPDDRERVLREAETLREAGAGRLDCRLKDDDSGYRWYEIRGAVVPGGGGDLAGVVDDVTERQRAERDLTEARRHLRSAFDSLPVAAAVTDATGNITETNQVWQSLHETDALAGRDFTPGSSYFQLCEAARSLPGRDLVRGARQVLGGSRERFALDYSPASNDSGPHFRVLVTPFMNPGIAGLVITHEDVTEQVRAAEAGRAESSVLDELLQFQANYIVRLDPDYTLSYTNAAFQRRQDKKRDKLSGKPFLNTMPKSARSGIRSRLDRLTPESTETGWDVIEAADGGRHERWTVRANFDGETPVSYDLTGRDVTAEQQESTRRNMLAAALDAAVEAVVVVDGSDTNWPILHANAAAGRLLGLNGDELVGASLAGILKHKGDEGWPERLAARIANHGAGKTQLKLEWDGRDIELSLAPIEDVGSDSRLVGVITDVSEHTRALEVSRHHRGRLERAAAGSDAGHWQFSIQRGRAWYNKRFNELLGVDDGGLERSVDALRNRIHTHDQSLFDQALDACRRQGTPMDLELRMEHESRGWRRFRLRGGGFPKDADEATHVAGAIQDVTERALATEASREALEASRLALRSAGLGTWRWAAASAGGVDRYEMDADARRMHGLSPSGGRFHIREVLRQVHPDDRHLIRQILRAQRGEGGLFHVEYRVPLSPGDERVISSRGRIYRSGDGRRVQIVGVCRDVTLEAGEPDPRAEMEAMLGRVGIGTWTADADSGRYEYDDVFCDLVGGSSPGDTLDGLLSRLDTDDAAALRIAVRDSMEDGTGFETQLPVRLPEDGSAVLALRVTPELDDDDRVVRLRGLAWDITEEAAAEDEQRDLVAMYGALLDAVPDPLVCLDGDQRFVFCNPAFATSVGRTAESFAGQHGRELFGADAFAEMEPRIRTALEGKIVTWVTDGDGEGSRRKMSLVPRHDESGRVTGCVVHSQEAGRAQGLEERLEQAEYLEAVGRLTGGVAHDFNNLLGVIVGNLELIQRHVADDDAARRQADTALRAATRSADLTQQLLAFSQRQHLAPDDLDVDVFLAEVTERVSGALGEAVHVTTRPAARDWSVKADPRRLEEALLCLASNGRDAMGGRGTVEIETAARELDGEPVPGSFEASIVPGEYVVISVRDTGEGIAADRLSRVIEPFYTTRDPNRFSGLGASMAFGFARQSGGFLAVESEAGQGTTVRLYLPRHVPEANAADAAPATVLVVESDADLRATAVALVESFGYRSLAAADGAEALEALAGDESVDLLFTDVALSGELQGTDLAERAVADRPGLAVLFANGYSAGAVRFRGRPVGRKRLVQKPYRADGLEEALRGALAAEEAG